MPTDKIDLAAAGDQSHAGATAGMADFFATCADRPNGVIGKGSPKSPLADRFQWPPFSYWDTQQGAWQDRKRGWIALGIRSEVGRKENMTYQIPDKLSDGSKGAKMATGTSIFDPCVAELAYKWWCPPGGIIVDPFAGGSVRGVVASVLGYKYWGGELRGEQVQANRDQITDQTRGQFVPKWVVGDSFDTLDDAPAANMIFSCPPYGDLETYSDDQADLSNMPYHLFRHRYAAIIEKAVAKLSDNSYCIWVVANFRDPKNGRMRDFVGDTIVAFERAGAGFYNDICLINCNGTGPMRAPRTFINGARKVIKLHQNVLVFVKGDPKLAAAKIPELGLAEEKDKGSA